MNTEPLLQRAYRLIDSSSETREQIASGAGVNFHWFCKLKQKAFSNPGVNDVEKVVAYLERKTEAA